MTTEPESRPGTKLPETSRYSRKTVRRDVLILAGLSLALSAARWCTLNSLWGDSPRWLFEVYRAASGEIIYKDFAWQYPPLPLLMCAGFFRLCGSTFWSIQLLLDVVSSCVVLLTWDLARRFLPRPLPLLTAAAMAAAGASNTSNFALFSLQIYTPAIVIGMVGLLLVFRESYDYLQTGTLDARNVTWLASGSAVCLLSKPEYIIGFVGCFAALALSDLRVWYRNSAPSDWLRHYARLFLACCVPALAGYAALAFICGSRNLLAGIGGYGLAALSCPWWPTGLGLFGAVAALGYGVIDAALLSLTRFQAFRQRYGNRYWLLWAAAVVSLVLGILYLPFCAELPMFQTGFTISHVVTYFLSTGTIFLPVMWFSIIFVILLAGKLFKALLQRTDFAAPDAILLVTLGSAALMSLRGLFNGTMTQLTLTSAAAYPVWFIIGPYLLVRFLDRADATSHIVPFSRAAAPVSLSAVLAIFLAIRLAGVFVGEIRPPYARIITPAGAIRVKDTSISPQVYAYVASHSLPHEPVLDIAGGGGINLGDRRPSTVFSTQWTALAPASRYLELDSNLIRMHPPRIIIADEGVDFGATYGICMNTGCTFPALVWRSTRRACDSSTVFPMLDYIRENYTPGATFGDKIIYVRRGR